MSVPIEKFPFSTGVNVEFWLNGIEDNFMGLVSCDCDPFLEVYVRDRVFYLRKTSIVAMRMIDIKIKFDEKKND